MLLLWLDACTLRGVMVEGFVCECHVKDFTLHQCVALTYFVHFLGAFTQVVNLNDGWACAAVSWPNSYRVPISAKWDSRYIVMCPDFLDQHLLIHIIKAHWSICPHRTKQNTIQRRKRQTIALTFVCICKVMDDFLLFCAVNRNWKITSCPQQIPIHRTKLDLVTVGLSHYVSCLTS